MTATPDSTLQDLGALLAQVMAAGGTRVILTPGAWPAMDVGGSAKVAEHLSELTRVPGQAKVKLAWLRALIAALQPSLQPNDAEVRRGALTLAGGQWEIEVTEVNHTAAAGFVWIGAASAAP